SGFVGRGVSFSSSSSCNHSVGTEIRTVDFRLNKETRKTLISQRTRISANYHTSSNQDTRITTIKNKKSKKRAKKILFRICHKNGDIPYFPIFTIIFKTSVFIRGNLTFILPCGPSVNRAAAYGFGLGNRRMGLESCFRSLWAVFRHDTFTTNFPRFLIRVV
ncbi:hypothetical protein IGI04_040265, partial [Brassica rapa subsp. trilocularis]